MPPAWIRSSNDTFDSSYFNFIPSWNAICSGCFWTSRLNWVNFCFHLDTNWIQRNTSNTLCLLKTYWYCYKLYTGEEMLNSWWKQPPLLQRSWWQHENICTIWKIYLHISVRLVQTPRLCQVAPTALSSRDTWFQPWATTCQDTFLTPDNIRRRSPVRNIRWQQTPRYTEIFSMSNIFAQIGYPSMDERERREINNTTMGYEEVGKPSKT